MKQKISYGKDAREKLLAGVLKLAEVVSHTLGPSGHNVILNLDGNPVATKDGVTIAKAVNLDDIEENTGAQMLNGNWSGNGIDEKRDKDTGRYCGYWI